MQNSFHAPVVLIFRERVLDHAHRLFPFDTGAFSGGRYTRWMHAKMPLESFEYPVDEESQGRHVTAFYGENRNYWEGEGLALENIAGQYEVEAVRSMIRDINTDEADDRRLAVELLVKEALPMTAEYLEAMYIPASIADADFVRRFKNDVNISVYTYRANKMKPAIEYQGLLEHLLAEFHVDLGVM
ncbi:hypothetical protein [Caballeronia sordidicola]|uniref:hypothetical protein n=1 Tax=Caballeronia sordidicola TaxID=196367 RepID=UPI001269BB6D|nr:hypothetical protein [Caballeronia sordidicola]